MTPELQFAFYKISKKKETKKRKKKKKNERRIETKKLC